MSQGHTMLCPSLKEFRPPETLPGEDIPEEWRVMLAEQFATAQDTNSHAACKSYRPCLPRTYPRAASGCGAPAPDNGAPAV